MHVIAAKAVAFREALRPEFSDYQRRTLENSRRLGENLVGSGFRLVSGGTDTHLVLVDLTETDFTGQLMEETLEKAGITVNKNAVPFDPRPPMVTSGVRIGTPAVTTRGMGEEEIDAISGFITRAAENHDNGKVLRGIRDDVRELCLKFPVYGHRL